MGISTAYHGSAEIKAKYVDRMKQHIAADELHHGATYGGSKGGKFRGCAVTCTLNSYDHAAYPDELGIPIELARMHDCIFESLPRQKGEPSKFALAFLEAPRPGADLSMVWPRLALWMLSDSAGGVQRATDGHADQRRAVDAVAALYREWIDTGSKPDASRWVVDAVSWTSDVAAADAADAAAAAAADDAVSAACWVADVARWADVDAAASAFWRALRDELLRLMRTA